MYYHDGSNHNMLYLCDTTVFKAFCRYHHRNTINVILFFHKYILIVIKRLLLGKSLNFSDPMQKMKELDYIIDQVVFQSYYFRILSLWLQKQKNKFLMDRKWIIIKYNKLTRNDFKISFKKNLIIKHLEISRKSSNCILQLNLLINFRITEYLKKIGQLCLLM